MVVSQGEVYWADLGAPAGSAPAFERPVIIVQSDRFNTSGLRTVVVCAVTTNLRRAYIPGHVLLAEGEAGLPRESVANPTQLSTLDLSALGERIGQLDPIRLAEVLAGISLVLIPGPAPTL